MSFLLQWEPKGVVIWFHGTLAENDMAAATASYQSDERFFSLDFVVADYSAVVASDVRPEAIKSVAVLDARAWRRNSRFRKAVVATIPEIVEMANHYQRHLRSPVSTEIFKTMAEARAWLDPRGPLS